MVRKVIEKIIGAKIVEVWSNPYLDGEKEYEIECNDGDIFIELDNGFIIKFWVSEWGGLKLAKRCKKCKNLMFFDERYINSPYPFPDGDICFKCKYGGE